MDPLRPEVHLALTLKEEFGQQLFTYSMEEGNVRFCKLTENMRAALIKEEDLPVNLAIVNNAASQDKSFEVCGIVRLVSMHTLEDFAKGPLGDRLIPEQRTSKVWKTVYMIPEDNKHRVSFCHPRPRFVPNVDGSDGKRWNIWRLTEKERNILRDAPKLQGGVRVFE